MLRRWLLRLRRLLLANVRVTILLWRRFRLSLSVFVAIIVLGTLILWLAYVDPTTQQGISFGQALYGAFSMLFFQSSLPFPEGPLEVLFFVVPILGLGVVAEGIISFSLLLLDRRNPSGEWTVALASTYSQHVVVCGLGHVGFRVLRQLLEFGQEVVAIELDTRVAFIERARRAGAVVLAGDATDLEVLRQAGTERAQAIVVATNNDLTNLDVVIKARQLNPDIRVVLRMFDADLAEKLGPIFGVQMALSASAIAAPAFATAAIREGVTHSFVLEGQVMNVSEMVVRAGGQLVGRTVQQLEEMADLSVVFLQRGQQRDMHPAAEACLQGGDKVVVFATLEQLAKLERWNQRARR